METKSMKRALRRHHVGRLKRNRKGYWGYGVRRQDRGFDTLPSAPAPMSDAQLGKVVQNPQMCSCMGCGNARRILGGTGWTRQESRNWQNYLEGLEELE